MSYTKTTWNTGDVITAQKLNHMEDGISSAQVYTESETVRFSGSVTTEETNGMYIAQIDCDLSDAPEQITVTFDGTEYTCEKFVAGVNVVYGGVGPNGPDFSEYPFAIVATMQKTGSITELYTETAGTHQVEITASTKAVNEDLADAISNKVMVVDFADTNETDVMPVAKVINAAKNGAIIAYRMIENAQDGNHIRYAENIEVHDTKVTFSVGSIDYEHTVEDISPANQQ